MAGAFIRDSSAVLSVLARPSFGLASNACTVLTVICGAMSSTTGQCETSKALGAIDASEVVFTHVDALWFDAKEREAAYAATARDDEDYVVRPRPEGRVELLPDADIALDGPITCDALAQGDLIVRIACEISQQMDGPGAEGMCPFGRGSAIELVANEQGVLLAKGACETLKKTASTVSETPKACRANLLVDYGDGVEIDPFYQWEGQVSLVGVEIAALLPSDNPDDTISLRCKG